MEDRKVCPIQEALHYLEASAKTQSDFTFSLHSLQQIISKLINNPRDWKTVMMQQQQENPMLTQHSLTWEDVQQFLKLIGFKEAEDIYEDGICDENMFLLEATLRVLNTEIQKVNLTAREEKPFPGGESTVNKQKHRRDDRSRRVSRVSVRPENQEEMLSESKEKRTRLQDILSRHLKHDHIGTSGVYNWRKNEASNVSFNSEGYFYQTSQKKDHRRRTSFFEEKFDRHDFKTDSRGCVFRSFAKMG